MKVLFPAVTCVLTSHCKPCLGDALESVVTQTRTDIHILVLDSGRWIGQAGPVADAMAAAHARYAGHPLVEWVTTGEGPHLAREKCPVAYVTNEAIRAGLVRGRYMCTFYDDDLYRPQFMERMAGFLDEHPEELAVWCSQNRLSMNPDGTTTFAGQIPAGAPKPPGTWDCQVDGAQVMWRTEVLVKIGDPWLPEDPFLSACCHSDGVFLNRLGEVCGPVPNLLEILVEHRFTPWSTYSPSTG